MNYFFSFCYPFRVLAAAALLLFPMLGCAQRAPLVQATWHRDSLELTVLPGRSTHHLTHVRLDDSLLVALPDSQSRVGGWSLRVVGYPLPKQVELLELEHVRAVAAVETRYVATPTWQLGTYRSRLRR